MPGGLRPPEGPPQLAEELEYVATAQSAFLTTGPVTIAAVNTFYDGPSLLLEAGTYLLWGNVVTTLGVLCQGTVKLWDGTNVFHTPTSRVGSTGILQNFTCHGYAVLAAQATVKVSFAINATPSGTCQIEETSTNGATEKSSSLVALKIA